MSVLLVSCGTIPASGPYSPNIKYGGNQVSVKIAAVDQGGKKLKYALAELDQNLLKYIAKNSQKTKRNYNWPENKAAQDITVNIGDTIQISIFESQSGGLFIPEDSSVRPGNFVSLPQQTIDATGKISVPYAGTVPVAGRTTQEIAQMIEASLKNKAIEPQVVVSFSNRSGAEVSVIGDVNNARRLSLGFNNYRVLDAIASAGGPVSPGYETKVSLQRAEKEYSIPFEDLVLYPEKNIYSQINDIIYLYREPQTFTAYGAVEVQGNIPFGKRNLVLSEALGLTRGLRDTQADPAEIYIYRQRKYPYFVSQKGKDEIEQIKIVDAKSNYSNKTFPIIGEDEARTFKKNKTHEKFKRVLTRERQAFKRVQKQEKQEKTGSASEEISVIFKLNMRNPSSFFLAQNFVMEDQDIIYAANAESVEFLKFLNIINPSSVTKINSREAF